MSTMPSDVSSPLLGDTCRKPSADEVDEGEEVRAGLHEEVALELADDLFHPVFRCWQWDYHADWSWQIETAVN